MIDLSLIFRLGEYGIPVYHAEADHLVERSHGVESSHSSLLYFLRRLKTNEETESIENSHIYFSTTL